MKAAAHRAALCHNFVCVGVTKKLGISSVSTPYNEIPKSPGLPLLGTWLERVLHRLPTYLHTYVDKRHRELGPIFRESMGGHELVFVADSRMAQEVFKAEGRYPLHVVPEPWIIYLKERRRKRGLFFMDGQEWLQNRAVMSRHLLALNSLQPYRKGLSDVADDVISKWAENFSHREVENLELELYRWNTESLGLLAFGARMDFVPSSREVLSLKDKDRFLQAVHGIFRNTAAMGSVPPRLASRLNLPSWRLFVRSVDDALDIGHAYINAAMSYNEAKLQTGTCNRSLLRILLEEEKMSLEIVAPLLIDLLLAAADTTTHTTMFALSLLAQHPTVVQDIRNSLKLRLASQSLSSLDPAVLGDLPLIKGSIKEAHRLFPVAPFLTRALDRDAILGGFLVPKGKMVIISLYTMGRDERCYAGAEMFRPERWVRDREEPQRPVHTFAFLPFGHGARTCIGKRFADLQMQLFLLKLLLKFDLAVDSDVEMVMRMVSVPKRPVKLHLTPLGG